MVVGTLAYQQKACDWKANDHPLNVAVAKLGQDLVDFMPGNRYEPLVDIKVKKAHEFYVNMGKQYACQGMEETLERFLPDVFKR